MSHEEEDHKDFSDEVNKSMRDKSMHEQHAQQHIPETGLKIFGKQGEDTMLKEIGQSHD